MTLSAAMLTTCTPQLLHSAWSVYNPCDDVQRFKPEGHCRCSLSLESGLLHNACLKAARGVHCMLTTLLQGTERADKVSDTARAMQL